MGPLPPAVLSGEEPIHLHVFLNAQRHPTPLQTRATSPSPTSSSSSFPLPIPPRFASPSPSISNEDIIARDEPFFTPEGSPAPSYFEPEVENVASDQAVENASEEGTELPDYEPPQRPVFPIPEDLEIGGWIHLQSDLVNHIIRRIHDNPQFFLALQLQFEGQDTIFGEDIQALEGLHIVCRRLERDARERAAAAEEGAVV